MLPHVHAIRSYKYVLLGIVCLVLLILTGFSLRKTKNLAPASPIISMRGSNMPIAHTDKIMALNMTLQRSSSLIIMSSVRNDLSTFPSTTHAHKETTEGTTNALSLTERAYTRNVTSTPFLDKLAAYNNIISDLRRDIVHKRGLVNYWKPISEPLQVLWGNKDDFLQRVSNFSHVTTIRMPWTPQQRVNTARIKHAYKARIKQHDHTNNTGSTLLTGDRDNMLLRDYYRWTATEPLCTWIRTKGSTKARWDAVYNRTCDEDIANASSRSRGLEVVYMYGKPINVRDYWPNNGDAYPGYFYTVPPSQVLYCHIVEDAIVTSLGDIISGSLKLVPYTCSQDTAAIPPAGYQHSPIYNEVFVISQFWGDAFFHKMIECFPRIAPYMSFLKRHVTVKIHVAELGGYTAASLEFLGIHPERLISGLCRAKVVYMPQSTPCGFAQLQSTQLLSMLYRDAIRKRSNIFHRDRIVLIERSGSRRFTQTKRLREAVQTIATAHGFSLEIFSDRPVPTMTSAMRMFNRAAIVVAPHGAGLSNIIYSEPGTYVVEGVCNRPHVNMCYQWLAHVLGHRYHAVPSRGGCEDVIDIDANVIRDTVLVYAKQITAARKILKD